MAGRGTEGRQLDGQQVQVRLPGMATSALAAAVQASGETTASWVRGRILAALEIDAGNVAAYRTTPSSRLAPSQEMLEMVRCRAAIADLTLALREAAVATGRGQRGASRQLNQLARTATGVVGDLDRLKAAMLARGSSSS